MPGLLIYDVHTFMFSVGFKPIKVYHYNIFISAQ